MNIHVHVHVAKLHSILHNMTCSMIQENIKGSSVPTFHILAQ